MITSLPGTDGREIGILRTFADEAERDAFYNSELFRDWEAYASTITEEPVYRQFNGLEAWFRSPTSAKMENGNRHTLRRLSYQFVFSIRHISVDPDISVDDSSFYYCSINGWSAYMGRDAAGHKIDETLASFRKIDY